MAVYLYRCQSGHDNLRPNSDGFKPSETVTCDRCHGEARRRYSPPTVIYKAAGFTGAASKPRSDGIQRR